MPSHPHARRGTAPTAGRSDGTDVSRRSGVRSLALVAVAAVLIAGCSSDQPPPAETTRAPNVLQGAGPGEEPRVIGTDEPVAVPTDTWTPQDVAFVQGMIHHHAQALLMVDMLQGRTDDRDLALFAERMQVSQTAEIDLYEAWLSERGQEVPLWEAARWEANLSGGEPHPGHGLSEDELMPGMLTMDELRTIAATEGADFERRWLEAMTRHHRGALDMVGRLYSSGGAQERTVAAFAADIEGDQAIEIDRMALLLAEL